MTKEDHCLEGVHNPVGADRDITRQGEPREIRAVMEEAQARGNELVMGKGCQVVGLQNRQVPAPA